MGCAILMGMGERERPDTLVSILKAVCDNMRSDEEKEHLKMVGRELYIRTVALPLALLRHPIAAIRAGLMIGDEETQRHDFETLRSMPQPSFLRGSQKFK